MNIRPYRRETRPAPRVPVELPQVHVTVDEHGRLDLRLNSQPYDASEAWHRADLPRVVDRIAGELGIPVRVEVTESDGRRYTDIITPPVSAPANSPAPADEPSPGRLGWCRSGFAPGQPVVIAVVIAHQIADADGTIGLGLPPALLASHGGHLICFAESEPAVGLECVA